MPVFEALDALMIWSFYHEFVKVACDFERDHGLANMDFEFTKFNELPTFEDIKEHYRKEPREDSWYRRLVYDELSTSEAQCELLLFFDKAHKAAKPTNTRDIHRRFTALSEEGIFKIISDDNEDGYCLSLLIKNDGQFILCDFNWYLA